MKKKILNTLLIIVALAAFIWCCQAKGLQWFIGFLPFLGSVYGLVGLNTDYIKNF